MKKIMLAVCLMTGIAAQSAQAVNGWKQRSTDAISTFATGVQNRYADTSNKKMGVIIVAVAGSIYLGKKGWDAIQAWRNQSAPLTEEQENNA